MLSLGVEGPESGEGGAWNGDVGVCIHDDEEEEVVELTKGFSGQPDEENKEKGVGEEEQQRESGVSGDQGSVVRGCSG